MDAARYANKIAGGSESAKPQVLALSHLCFFILFYVSPLDISLPSFPFPSKHHPMGGVKGGGRGSMLVALVQVDSGSCGRRIAVSYEFFTTGRRFFSQGDILDSA